MHERRKNICPQERRNCTTATFSYNNGKQLPWLNCKALRYLYSNLQTISEIETSQSWEFPDQNFSQRPWAILFCGSQYCPALPVSLSPSPVPSMPRAKHRHCHGYKNQHVPCSPHHSWCMEKGNSSGVGCLQEKYPETQAASSPDPFLKGRGYKTAWSARLLSKTSIASQQFTSKNLPLPSNSLQVLIAFPSSWKKDTKRLLVQKACGRGLVFQSFIKQY